MNIIHNINDNKFICKNSYVILILHIDVNPYIISYVMLILHMDTNLYVKFRI